MNVGVQGEAMNVILHLCNLGLSFLGGPSELLTFVQNPFTFFVHTHQIVLLLIQHNSIIFSLDFSKDTCAAKNKNNPLEANKESRGLRMPLAISP